MKFVPHLIVGVLCFFCAKGIVYLYACVTGKRLGVILAFFISMFLLWFLVILSSIIIFIYGGIITWIEEKIKSRRKKG